MCRLTARLHHNPRPLSTVKDAAYAWGQMVLHLSLCTPGERARVLAWLDGEAARNPGHVGARLAPAVAGLRLVADGRTFDSEGMLSDGRARCLLGWTSGGHWILPEPDVGPAPAPAPATDCGRTRN